MKGQWDVLAGVFAVVILVGCIYFLTSGSEHIETPVKQERPLILPSLAEVSRHEPPASLPSRKRKLKPFPARGWAATERAAVELPSTSVLKESIEKKTDKKFQPYLVLGVGANYMRFAQMGSELKSLDYSTVKPFSHSIKLGFEHESGFGVEAGYGSYPGSVQSQNVTIQNGEYDWQSQSLEAIYTKSQRFRFRAGIQRHELPYVNVTSLTSAEMKRQELMQLTVGAEYFWLLTEKVKPQVLFRYHVPFRQKSSGAENLRSKSNFAFDGSLGVDYQIEKKWSLGMFWYGQWQEYDYSMINQATLVEDNGTNTYFFSNLEFRLRFNF